MRHLSLNDTYVVVMLTLSLYCCQREPERVIVWGNGTANGLINGKSTSDPEFVLRPPGYPLFSLGSYATRYVGADSITNNVHSQNFRKLFLSIYSKGGYQLGDFVVELADFAPGSKNLNKYEQDDRFQNYSSYLYFDGGGDFDHGPSHFAVFDESKPYSVVIDGYDPAVGVIRGRLDIHYKLTKFSPDFGLDSITISRIHLSEAKFEAKIRKRDENGWLDEQQ